MKKPVEMEDIENAMDAFRQARDPMIKFSLDPGKMNTRAIVLMQTGIDQAICCLQHVCNEVNRGTVDEKIL